MIKRKHIIIGNWKLNPVSEDEAKKIIRAVHKMAKVLKRTEMAMCPPYVYLNLIKPDNKKVFAGVQDVFWQPSGAFTGEISSEMARFSGAKYVIIGHSERRALGETDEMVAKKTCAALMAGLKAVVCVGEKTRDQSGDYLGYLKNQIKKSLDGVKKKFVSDLLIAYEPVWAIGRPFNEAMQPSDIHETTLFIKRVIAEIFGKDWVNTVRVIYGGSVNWENAGMIVGGGEVDGLLPGRESVNPEGFKKLLNAVDAVPI